MQTPLEKLQLRWRKKTGEEMPESIACLPIGRVLIAVERTEDGETVFVPGVPVLRDVSETSMKGWDHDSEY